MASETRTFSTLSELTGLRGGNLLFHIQKLLETDLILQRHERGDYMITKKGFNLLMMLAEFLKITVQRIVLLNFTNPLLD